MAIYHPHLNPEQRAMVRDHLLAAPAETLTALSTQTGWSVSTIWRIRQRLVADGHLPPAVHGRRWPQHACT